MKTILFFTCAVLTFNLLHSIDVSFQDEKNLFYYNSTMSFNFRVKKGGPDSEVDEVLIANATAIPENTEVRDSSVFYTFTISQLVPSFVSSMSLMIEAQRSADSARRYVKEFELNVTFNNSTQMSNWTGTTLTFVVRPPRFPHFQVKTDWQYRCPKTLSLGLCHVANGTTACSTGKPFDLVSISVMFLDTIFSGGMPLAHDYQAAGKVEECPLAYESKKDIGIACIAVFWSIALAAVLWGVIKFLVKRHKNRLD